MEKSRVIIEDPPTDKKGNGMPVTGRMPKFIPILTKACIQIWILIPKVNKNKARSLVIKKAFLNKVEISK